MKVKVPKVIPGDREFENWVRNVSKAVGVNPPQTLEEVGEASIVPTLSRLNSITDKLSTTEKQSREQQRQIQELQRKISDLERLI